MTPWLGSAKDFDTKGHATGNNMAAVLSDAIVFDSAVPEADKEPLSESGQMVLYALRHTA